jgi:prepilin-type N-terminal cleavage/methylation domain-containing protein
MVRTKKQPRTNKGFTLIEILVVIGIIAILAAVVIVALNPARQFAQARNAQRSSNVNTLLNAVSQRMADYRGLWTTGGTTGCNAAIPMVAANIGSGSGNLNLAPCIVPTYVSTMVYDPSGGTNPATQASTGYTMFKDANGRITVNAPYAELGTVISVTR